ncbi:MAG: IS607 family element RNA-guided endonuclease TnpB [Acidimicrobiales bacterium]
MTVVHQGFRFELDPNDSSRAKLSSHTGASRFAYNFGLALVKQRLSKRAELRAWALDYGLCADQAEVFARSVEVPWNLYSLRREWNCAKSTVAAWWPENSKEAYSSGLDGLARALENFSKARDGERAGPSGFPLFKNKSARNSCRFTTGAIKVVDGRHVQLPRIGVLRTKEPTTKLQVMLECGSAKILSATISELADRWFVSFACELERSERRARCPSGIVAVDLGVKPLATLSSGEIVENPKVLSRYQRQMASLQRKIARQQSGSRRRARTKAKLARTHKRVGDARRDVLHKLTTELVETYGTVVIEDLAVKNMTRSASGTAESPGTNVARKSGLNRAILDVAPAEFRRQLTYKMAWRSGRLIVADRFYPSSKTCSSCGQVRAKLSLDERSYTCEHCGLVIDRDLNAAINLAAYGRGELELAGSGPETPNARRGDRPRLRSRSPLKREDGTGSPDRTVTASSQGEAA